MLYTSLIFFKKMLYFGMDFIMLSSLVMGFPGSQVDLDKAIQNLEILVQPEGHSRYGRLMKVWLISTYLTGYFMFSRCGSFVTLIVLVLELADLILILQI